MAARIAADGPGGILVRSWGALATYRALPEDQRIAVELHHLQGLPLSQIAAQLADRFQ